MRRTCWAAGAAVLLCVVAFGACTDDENGAGRDDDEPVRDDEGQVLDETEVNAYRIHTGDCFNGEIPFAVQNVAVVPCNEPHDQEAYAIYNLEPDPSGSADEAAAEEGEDGEDGGGGEEGDDGEGGGGSEDESAEEEPFPYPGDTRVHQLSQRGCLVRFGEYVGTAYEVSTLEIGLLMPTEQTWTEIGDREVICTVHRADGSRLDTSAEGSGI